MKHPEDYINKIICGDCLEVMKGIPDKAVDLVLTDPPYNISFGKDIQRNWRPNDLKRNFGDWDKDFKPEPYAKEFLRLANKGVMCFTSSEVFGEWIALLKDSFDYCKYLVWEKSNPSPSIRKKSWRQATELIIHAHNIDALNFLGQAEMRNLINNPTCSNESLDHPNQKPVELIRKLLIRCSNEGDIILDPFSGSGSIALACKQLNRKFIGIEINQKYCEIAQRRLSQEYLF